MSCPPAALAPHGGVTAPWQSLYTALHAAEYSTTDRCLKDIAVSLQDGSKATASFKDGVVTVTLPKAPEAKGTTIPVKAA
jgi:hypothetical protein